ncbi:cyclic pyranopterin phosphate synthase [Sphingobium xanthum]|nr:MULTISPECIES: GTP 3',8-cyclase MoaA [Sphingobium]MCW2361653.1 cyclic pyranopterin phosphate synthase [Sphingobium sp. B10D3B]MCW2401668.1 cyclic pyranopterin phosphate synthase [Sphingobium sp. B10D7B]MCW2408648.1 cyclic pyranopterin phosphate synthase [Sphingobium xanthum]
MANAIDSLPDAAPAMRDSHGRRIDYLRISVTDRCDLRCRYCMSETMQFLPRREILTLEEIAVIAERFIARGVRRIRLSGGEPLVRRDFGDLARALGPHVKAGRLDELTLTTNGTQLATYADMLFDAGIRRINVSLDALDPEIFAHVTRGGDIAKVLGGLEAARQAGLKVKLNTVALRDTNEGQILPLLDYCAEQGFDLTLIETMPLGEVAEDRSDRFLPLIEAIAPIRERHALIPLDDRTGGPARYFALSGLKTRLGLITPLSQNFCADCNRMRLTCQGRIYMCLGHEDHIDLKAAFREQGVAGIDALLDRALAAKPLAHDFSVAAGAQPATRRHMSVTGG